MDDVPDGYARLPGGGLRLVDPSWCPAGHMFEFGQRGGVVHCRDHGRHLYWRCACRTVIYRHAGEFTADLACQRSDGGTGSAGSGSMP